ncbi:MAG: hypothetical protein LBF01_02825, partial [Bacteroidales bacterium]|nr:hypothetical protein [Bacteroidales bacterium]
WSDFDTSTDIVLSFSQDTVSFDTVFTTIPTVTKWITVRNGSKKSVKISHIYVEGFGDGRRSAFRLNVDGDTSLTVNDVIVGARDSFYIFITANIEYLKNASFGIVSDNIVFAVNGREQRLALQAWGQNAYYHFPDPDSEYKFLGTEGDTQVMHYFDWSTSFGNGFPTDKPHVFFGYAAVSNGETANIPAGAQLYFAGDAGLWIQSGASLNVQGTFPSPVLFTSLRQDNDYKTTPGQWGGIRIDAESIDNQINYAEIRNAQFGVMIDSSSMADMSGYAIEIYNTRIENMTRYGIFCRKNFIKGVNVLVANCANGVSLINGGGGLFFHCTFTNYYSSFSGAYSVILNDHNGELSQPFSSIEFVNCIIFGKTSDQIDFDLKEKVSLPYLFDHCITGTPVTNDRFVFCSQSDPLFVEKDEANYEISSDRSPAYKAGNTTFSDPAAYRDIKNVQRGMPPTIGAYEYVKPVNP